MDLIKSDGDRTGRHRLRSSGGYRTLRSFQVATLIYDATVSFCDRFVDKRSRTHDQMVQAARSGGKNIAEGSRAGAATSRSELRLVNVARASLEELLLDYEDYLCQHGHRLWKADDPEALEVRAVARGDRTDRSDRSDPTDQSVGRSADYRAAQWKAYAHWLEHRDPAVVANTMLCLIHQANYLLDQQISALERDFVKGGGYTEQLAAARIAERQKQQQAPQAKLPTAPACPHCGKPMALRTARKGSHVGSQFWGCSNYPQCKGIRPVDGEDRTDRSDQTDQRSC
ncbi:DNA topoisomerase, type IA, zn finger domain protein [Verrucomicrobia bacterium]|nr:DNA topoisomerase, type IA, zn finger domain protein [Verrucomicrobiota bacterium]